jgi:hypothetical protein
MAKRRKARKSRARKSAATPGKTISSPKYHNKTYHCYGKMTKTRGSGKAARVFCRKVK